MGKGGGGGGEGKKTSQSFPSSSLPPSFSCLALMTVSVTL